MGRTEIRGSQIDDGSVQRVDLDTTTTGQAVTTKIVAGNGISLSSTGVDAGTGDVTVNTAAPTSIGTLDSQSKSANGAVISSNALFLQSADASNPGLITIGSQTIAGIKTLSDILQSKTHLNFAGSEYKRYTAAQITTDATITNLLTISVSANSLGRFIVSLSARREDGTDKYYWCFLQGGVRRSSSNSGNATIVGNTFITDDSEGSPGYSAIADVSSDLLRIRVTGEASQNVIWTANVEYQEVLLSS